MKTRYKVLIGVSIFAVLIVSLISLQFFNTSKTQPATPMANQTFDKLPPGLAPAVANALNENLPESYHIKKLGNAYHTKNESHGMQYAFTSNGPTVQSADGSWKWEMTLNKFGYEGHLKPVAASKPTVNKRRVEYKRGPSLTEWYKNTAFGLEQGFTLNKRPNCLKQKDSNLALEIVISGTLTPQLQGKALLLQNKKGETLSRYTGLYAYDANHQELPARLMLAVNNLNIIVDDTNAVYPVTIDPWVQKAELTAYDAHSSSNFAKSVAISYDTIVVGASGDYTPTYDTGAAFVYEKPANGWSTTDTYSTMLIPGDGAAGDKFGKSVDIYYGDIVVGAPNHDTGAGETDAGQVYVFERPISGSWADAGETMTEDAKLTASPADRNAYDQFGSSVAIGSDIIVIGAQEDDHESDTDPDWGAAYVFEKDKGEDWTDSSTPSTKLVASDRYDDSHIGDEFGNAVDVRSDGDAIIVGAKKEGEFVSGAAYIFKKPIAGWSASSTTNETGKLTSSDRGQNDYFGTSVAISGGTVVIGAPSKDVYCDYTSHPNIGIVYVFEQPAGGWATMTETAKLETDICTDNQYFGTSVAIDGGDMVVVGVGTGAIERAYIFEKPDSGWTDMAFTSQISARGGTGSENFGTAVALDGDAMIVGASSTSGTGGTAYVFHPIASMPWMIPLLLE